MKPLLAERGEYPIVLGDKGYISQQLQAELIETQATVLLPTRKEIKSNSILFEFYANFSADASSY